MTNALLPRAADDPATRPPAGSLEERFMTFLTSAPLSYQVTYEPDTFEVPNWYGRKGGFTPDLRLDGRGAESFADPVYLELTEADLYLSADDLPLRVRRHNKLHSRSRRAHITPAEYLELKRLKIELTRRQKRYSWLRVELLTAADQARYLADPPALITLIEQLRAPQLSTV